MCYELLTCVYRRERKAPVYIILLKLIELYKVLTRLKLQTSVFLSRPDGRFISRSTWNEFRPKHTFRQDVSKVYSKDRLGSATSPYGICGNISEMATFNHLTPNGHFSGRTAPLNSRCCIFFIQQIYVLNILNMLHTLCFFLFKMPFVS